MPHPVVSIRNIVRKQYTPTGLKELHCKSNTFSDMWSARSRLIRFKATQPLLCSTGRKLRLFVLNIKLQLSLERVKEITNIAD